MRHLGALKLVCNYRNLRLLNAQRRISYQLSRLFVCVECVLRTYVCGTRTCVWYPRMCGTSLARARISYVAPMHLYAFVYNQCM